MEEENYHYHRYANQLQLNNSQSKEKQTRPSRLGLRTTAGGGGGGEIVEVQGGHIVRSIGRKDRHSKVCTAKGPRDRRVRLSAHTAIQFYDVQDRLGYDRPSKAVDWLIKKAKSAIDELEELPAWKPSTGVSPSPPILNVEQNENPSNGNPNKDDDIVENHQNSRFLPNSLDSIKSFFPTGASSTPQFHHNFPQSDQNQDLKLSLQSFPDPIPHHQNGNGNGNGNGSNFYFDGSGWPENGGLNGGFNGFLFNSPPQTTQSPPFLTPSPPFLLGQPTNNQFLLNYISQRGPLQSSNTPPVRAWVDPPPFSAAAAAAVIDHHQTLPFHHHHHPASISGYTSGGFSGFHIPARIQGDDEEHDGISEKPSSASSDSIH